MTVGHVGFPPQPHGEQELNWKRLVKAESQNALQQSIFMTYEGGIPTQLDPTQLDPMTSYQLHGVTSGLQLSTGKNMLGLLVIPPWPLWVYECKGCFPHLSLCWRCDGLVNRPGCVLNKKVNYSFPSAGGTENTIAPDAIIFAQCAAKRMNAVVELFRCTILSFYLEWCNIEG